MSSQSYIYNPTERTLAAAGDGFSCPRLTTAGRTALSLTANDKGMMVYDTTLTDLCIWNGSAWEFVADNSSGIFNVRDYGAIGDGITNDTAAITAALNAAAGQVLLFEPNKTYLVTSSLVVNQNTFVDINGSTIKFATVGAVKNLDVRSGCIIINGTIENAGSAFAGSGDFQCPIIIGEYGSGVGYNNIVIENMTIKSIKPDGNGIMVTGSSSNVAIKNIVFPDSAFMTIPILVHWGGANNPALGTFHPNDISITDISIGSMTYAPASDVGQVLISAAYNVVVDNVNVQYAKNAGLYLFAGDYGFFYAPAAIKPLANTGISVRNFSVWNSSKYGCVIRGDAAFAPGAPKFKIPAIVENLTIAAATNNGINLQYAQDTKFIGCTVANAANGIVADTSECERIRIIGGTFRNNVDDGIWLKNNATDCVVDGAHCYANGYAGMETTSTNTRVLNCTFGSVTEATQDFGIRVGPSSIGDIIENNICLGATNTAFSLANGTSYGTISSFVNNVGPSGTTGTGGLLQVPFAQLGAGNTAKKMMYGTAIPASGTWAVGDLIFNIAPASGGFIGWACTTAGTPGTWKTFGLIS